MKANLLISIVFLAFGAVSCSSIRSATVATTGDIIYNASFQSEQEASWENFQKSIPSTLKFAEGLWYLRQDDQDLLVSLIKGFVGYAFTVDETLMLDDVLADVEDGGSHKSDAIANYTKAMQYGMKYLQLKEASFDQLVLAMKEKNGVSELLSDKFSDDKRDLEGLMFTAQALSSLINLQKAKVSLYPYIPLAKEMFDWVCSKKPDMNNGACGIFYGSYESARPVMLGGNPAEGKKIFEETIAKYPSNWLARAMYMQFYLIPMSDAEGFAGQKEFFEINYDRYYDAVNWNPNLDYEQMVLGDRNNRLYQAIALKRYGIMKKHAKTLF